MIQQRKRNKENFQIPKDNKSKMMRQHLLVTSPYSSNPTPGALLWTIDGS